MKEDKEMTAAEVAALLNVTVMTINNWKKGARTDRAVLPSHSKELGKRTVARFWLSEVKAWAKANGIAVGKERATRNLPRARAHAQESKI